MPLNLSTFVFHLGMLDGSAGVAVSEDAFLSVSDERNVVRLYATDAETPATDMLRLDDQKDWFVHTAKDPEKVKDGEPPFCEADIEGAAQVFDADGKGGSVIYWITSFGAADKKDKKGKVIEHKEHKERRLFFATRMTKDGSGRPALAPEGEVRTDLLDQMIAAAKTAGIDLKEASDKDAKAGPDPKGKPTTWGGLNIESLCASADGKTLFIGFRNPVPEGKAILLPLHNAAEIVKDANAKPEFGAPLRPDLGGLGFRDMVWCRHFGGYLIIGGHCEDHLDRLDDESVPKPHLFLWTDLSNSSPKMLVVPGLEKLKPEALVLFGKSAAHPVERVLILSDDGALNPNAAIEECRFARRSRCDGSL